MKYQKNFSKLIPSVLDPAVRKNKAKKITSIIVDYLKSGDRAVNNHLCLDIGGSAGFAAMELSKYSKDVYVIDIDEEALQYGIKNNHAHNIHYQVGDAMNLNFRDNSFTIVICNQVYEHVPSSKILIQEIYRILEHGGICFFGAGNRLKIMEDHYNLPFLSWLPKPLANVYLRIAKKGNFYYENLLSYYGLRKILKPFQVIDYTYEVIKHPVKFYNTDVIKQNSWLTKIPRIIYLIIKPIIPGYLFILKK